MRGKANKISKGVPPVPSPGSIQRYMSGDTSIVEDGYGSPKQGIALRTGTSRQKTLEEENKARKLNDSVTTWPKSNGNNSQGSSKAQNGVQKKREGGEPLREESSQLIAQEGVPQIKEMLAEMLIKMEVSLKLWINWLDGFQKQTDKLLTIPGNW